MTRRRWMPRLRLIRNGGRFVTLQLTTYGWNYNRLYLITFSQWRARRKQNG